MITAKKQTLFVLASSFLLSLSGCSNGGGATVNPKDAPKFIEQEFVDFRKGQSSIFEITSGYSNGDPFGCTWTSDNAIYAKDAFELKITKDGDKWYGGEQRTAGSDGTFLYGYFGCYMKPAKVEGTASTFFTYTGPSENNPHDEIDIEFLGKDTTKVQFNYFVDDSHGNEYIYDLGFDASEEYHQYGFYWGENEIVWYVDLKPVYKVADKIPSHYCRIFQNFWCGEPSNLNIMGWMGHIKESDVPATASYQKVTYADLNGIGVEVPEPEKAPEPEDMLAMPLEFHGSTPYTLTNNSDNTSFDVTYTEVAPKTYKNVYAETDDIAAYKYFSAKVKNNGAEKVMVRVDIAQRENVTGTSTKCCNVMAWLDGLKVRTDVKYGGSFFELEAGAEARVTIQYRGLPYRAVFMFDSAGRDDKEVYAGSLTVSDYRFSGEQDYVPPIEEPEEIDPSTYIIKDLAQQWVDGAGYTISPAEDGHEIAYDSIVGDSYANVSVEFDDIPKATGTLRVKVANRGDAAINLRADLLDTDGECPTISGSGTGGAKYNSMSASTGGLYFQIAPQSEGWMTFQFEGIFAKMRLFIDSCGSDKKTHAGTLFIGEAKLECQRIIEAEEKALDLEWASGITDPTMGTYTISKTEEGNKVDYSVQADSYAYIEAKNVDEQLPELVENLQFVIHNENDREIILSLLVKNGRDVITNGGKVVDGDATFSKHSGNDGEKFVIAANGTATLRVEMSVRPSFIGMEIDSLSGALGVTNEGSITILDSRANAPVNPDDGANVENPFEAGWFAVGTGYAGEKVENGYQVTYKNVADNSWYGGVDLHHISDVVEGGTYFEIAIVNCNKRELYMSVRIQNASSELITVNSAANSVVYGEGSYYHYSSGNGPYFKLAPLSTSIVHVPYSGAPDKIRMNLDSIVGVGGTLSGSVVIKGIASDGQYKK